jgi:uncharacterized protein
MANVLMGLGTQNPATEDGIILFYVPLPNNDTPGFESLQRDAQYTWVSNDRLSRDPAMQFVGPGEENIVVEGRMFPYHFGGLSTIDRLRAAGRAGKPYILARFYPLKDPAGYSSEVIGNFVIKRVRTVESKIGTIGIAHKIDFTLELARYGDDKISSTGSSGGGVQI